MKIIGEVKWEVKNSKVKRTYRKFRTTEHSSELSFERVTLFLQSQLLFNMRLRRFTQQPISSFHE